MRLELDESSFDFSYYKNKAWFESGCFYLVRLGPIKTLASRFFDSNQKRLARKRKSQEVIGPALTNFVKPTQRSASAS